MNDDTHKKHQNAIAIAEVAVAKAHKNAAQDPHRLRYHFMAPASWMNDPNGLIQFNGEYHMFYQQHPFSADNGPKYWGHAKSKDLVHWEHLPIALAPGEWYDRDACFSGSAVNDQGILTLIYTGIRKGEDRKQVQCLATSTNGIAFMKHPENPIISDPPPEGSVDFRDPKVWRHDGTWYMVVGSGKDGIAKALLYQSSDLREWEYIGPLAESNGNQGRVWNCPDFFPLGDQHILIVSPLVTPTNKEGGQNIYIVGEMDYSTGQFTQKYDAEIDHGFDFYAAQTFIDDQGRVILIAWMDMWWNTMPTKEYDWTGAMTIPRVLDLLPDGKLSMQPIPELQKLRQEHYQFQNLLLTSTTSNVLGNLEGDSFELVVKFQWDSAREVEQFGFKLRCSEDGREKTLVSYRPDNQELSVDRTESGSGEGGISTCRVECTDERMKWHIFLDRSSVEVFANNGQAVMSNRIYPHSASLGMDMFASGGSVQVTSLDVWRLASIW